MKIIYGNVVSIICSLICWLLRMVSEYEFHWIQQCYGLDWPTFF